MHGFYYTQESIFYYYLSQISESAQAIDSQLGRSVHIEVESLLDMQLMEEKNMLKQEGKIIVSERWILINHLVAEAIEQVTKKDEMRVGCFVRTGSLIQQTKSKADNLIKPQGVKSKTIILDNYVEDEEIGEFIVPSAAITLEEENIGNITTNIIEDSVDNIVDNISNLAIYEVDNKVDPELCCKEVMEDDSVAESANKFDFQT